MKLYCTRSAILAPLIEFAMPGRPRLLAEKWIQRSRTVRKSKDPMGVFWSPRLLRVERTGLHVTVLFRSGFSVLNKAV